MILLKCNPANCHSPLYINGFGDKKAERLFYQNKRSTVARFCYLDTNATIFRETLHDMANLCSIASKPLREKGKSWHESRKSWHECRFGFALYHICFLCRIIRRIP